LGLDLLTGELEARFRQSTQRGVGTRIENTRDARLSDEAVIREAVLFATDFVRSREFIFAFVKDAIVCVLSTGSDGRCCTFSGGVTPAHFESSIGSSSIPGPWKAAWNVHRLQSSNLDDRVNVDGDSEGESISRRACNSVSFSRWPSEARYGRGCAGPHHQLGRIAYLHRSMEHLHEKEIAEVSGSFGVRGALPAADRSQRVGIISEQIGCAGYLGQSEWGAQ